VVCSEVPAIAVRLEATSVRQIQDERATGNIACVAIGLRAVVAKAWRAAKLLQRADHLSAPAFLCG
jgi:hypothetical protein